MPATPDPHGQPIVAYFVRFHTEDDDKDKDDTVSATVLRPSDNQVLSDKAPVGDPHDTWGDQTDNPDPGDTRWGRRGWFGLDTHAPYLNYGEGAKLRIAKSGNSRWKFRVDLMVMVQGDQNEYITFTSDKRQLDKDGRDVTFDV